MCFRDGGFRVGDLVIEAKDGAPEVTPTMYRIRRVDPFDAGHPAVGGVWHETHDLAGLIAEWGLDLRERARTDAQRAAWTRAGAESLKGETHAHRTGGG